VSDNYLITAKTWANGSMTDAGSAAAKIEREQAIMFALIDIAQSLHQPKKLWVVQVEWHGPEGGDYGGWVSVHRTKDGAEQRLNEKLADYDLDRDAIDSGEDNSGSTYMLALLPVEE